MTSERGLKVSRPTIQTLTTRYDNMAKEKTVWFCTNCGNESPKWMGRCPACGEWNTMVEQTVVTGKATRPGSSGSTSSNKPVDLRSISSAGESRIPSGLSEVDRLLGGRVSDTYRRRTRYRKVYPVTSVAYVIRPSQDLVCIWRGERTPGKDEGRQTCWGQPHV